MKAKKNTKSDLEKKSTLFFQMGIAVALCGMLVAFEWGNPVNDNLADVDFYRTDNEPAVIIDIIRTKPPMLKPPIVPEELIIIKDELPDVEIPEIDFGGEIGTGDAIDYISFEPEPEELEPDPFIKVEEMPEYRGGSEIEFQRHVQQMVVYPQDAVDMGIQGKVFVNFVIDKNGKLTKPLIVRSPDELLSKAVLAALLKTEKWKPGEQRKRRVPVTFTIPVSFRLQ